MLRAVEFDNQAAFQTAKIRDEGWNGMLATKLEVLDLPTAKSSPQLAFRVSQLASQAPRAHQRIGRQWWLDPFRHVDFPGFLHSPAPGVVRTELTNLDLGGHSAKRTLTPALSRGERGQ